MVPRNSNRASKRRRSASSSSADDERNPKRPEAVSPVADPVDRNQDESPTQPELLDLNHAALSDQPVYEAYKSHENDLQASSDPGAVGLGPSIGGKANMTQQDQLENLATPHTDDGLGTADDEFNEALGLNQSIVATTPTTSGTPTSAESTSYVTKIGPKLVRLVELGWGDGSTMTKYEQFVQRYNLRFSDVVSDIGTNDQTKIEAHLEAAKSIVESLSPPSFLLNHILDCAHQPTRDTAPEDDTINLPLRKEHLVGFLEGLNEQATFSQRLAVAKRTSVLRRFATAMAVKAQYDAEISRQSGLAQTTSGGKPAKMVPKKSAIDTMFHYLGEASKQKPSTLPIRSSSGSKLRKCSKSLRSKEIPSTLHWATVYCSYSASPPL